MHRGISTIVGGVIFLVLLSAGFSTFFVAMDVQSDTINAQRSISNSIIEKTQEQFSIVVATDDSNSYKLGIQVKNEGPNPVQISNFWIINKSLPNQPVYNIPINYSDAFITSGSNSSILENQHLTMKDPTTTPGFPDLYDIKVISTLGTIQKTELKVGGNDYLLAELFTIPPDVRQGENATIALMVTNVGPTMISGVTPDNLLLDDALPPHAEVSYVGPVSVGPLDLNPSESTIFSWDVTLESTASIGVKVKFSNFATGTESVTGFGVSSNIDSNKIIIRNSQGGSGGTILINEDLYSKPQIFMIIPGPFGDQELGKTDKGLWGVNVINPTDSVMEVTKVVISAIEPQSDDGWRIFLGQDHPPGCQPLNISPWGVPGAGDWDCIHENQLTWQNLANPISIPKHSVYPFLAKVDPGEPHDDDIPSLESIPIHVSVVTSSGQFGKGAYVSSMRLSPPPGTNGEVIANVFLGNGLGTINNNNINSIRTGILANSMETFNVFLTDFGTDGAEHIRQDTKLIINVPKGWTVPAPPSSDADWNISYNPFPDGSSQIVGELKNDLSSGGKKITFTAQAPNVQSTELYVMHILASGQTDNTFTVSPLEEIILQVVP